VRKNKEIEGLIDHFIDSTELLTSELLNEDFLSDLGGPEEPINLLIPLTAFDIEILKDVVYNDSDIEWTFEADTGEKVCLFFKNEQQQLPRRHRKCLDICQELPVELEHQEGMHTSKELDLKGQLEELYEAIVGENGHKRFTHVELIEAIYEMYDNAKE
jgi:hypothetical protein